MPHETLRFLLRCLALWALALSGLACTEPVENILLITVDTLRTDHVGAYGGVVSTPAMDRLAEEGVTVEGACTPTPSTGPAHASLMTGLYPWNHGILLNAVPLDDPQQPVLAELLLEAGFKTAAFVSSFNVDQRWGFGRGIETFHFEPDKIYEVDRGEKAFWSRGEFTTTAALRWLEKHAGDRFFLWLHYFDPHDPYDPPPPYVRPVAEEVDLEGKRLPGHLGSMAELRELIRAYRGEVAYTDAQVGRLIEALSRHDILEKTAIIFTSDHGEGLGDHGLLGHGRNLHDELITVPLILRAPSLPAGRRLEGAAQLEDLMPTILALAEVSAPADLDGRNLLPWLRGEEAGSPRTAAVGRRAAFHDLPSLYFERRWPEKWIGELEGEGDAYRLDRDPGERSASALPRVPNGLRSQLVGGMKEARERILDEETRQALEALGYL